jgi:hypothetical protein
MEISNLAPSPSLLVPGAVDPRISYEQTRVLVGGDPAVAANLYRVAFASLVAAGNDADELLSDFRRIYREVENEYLWLDDGHLARWRRLLLARFWIHQRALIGREAAMRLIGIRVLSGRAPQWMESSYDLLYPIYDPAVELLNPVERPSELRAMDWELLRDDSGPWLNGLGAADWKDYPTSYGDLRIIGERSLFIRPEWEWPREERYRGIVDSQTEPVLYRESLASGHELTYGAYLQGEGQTADQLVVWNREQQLVGPTCRWIALNSKFARSLGWMPSQDRCFEWVDAAGRLMVKSLFWRDGWVDLEPPRFESLGEGWLVLATAQAIEKIHRERPNAYLHLWVERHSHGRKPYDASWHLVSGVSEKTS